MEAAAMEAADMEAAGMEAAGTAEAGTAGDFMAAALAAAGDFMAAAMECLAIAEEAETLPRAISAAPIAAAEVRS